MLCKNCGKEIAEKTAFCAYCGQPVTEADPIPEVTLEGETDTVLSFEEAPKSPKKKPWLLVGLIGGGAALLAIAFFVLAFIFGWFGIGRGAPKDLYRALYNLAEAENFTVENTYTYEKISGGEEYYFESDSIQKVDFAKGLYLSEGDSRDNDGENAVFATGFEKDYEYSYSNTNNATVSYARLTEESETSKNVTAAYKLALEILKDGDIDVDKLLKLEYMSSVKEAIDDGQFTKKDLEKTLVVLYENLNDKQWLEENLGFTCTKSGNDQIYRLNTNYYQVSVTMLESFRKLLDEKEYTSTKNRFEKNKKSSEKQEIVLSITVSCDAIKQAEYTISYKEGKNSQKTTETMKVTEIGKTELSLSDLRKKILKANNDYIDCSVCEGSAATYMGLCYDCYSAEYCIEDCGNKADEAYGSRCEDCFIPCVACMEFHASEHNDKNDKDYCYSCFSEMFCDCGATIYMDGKCKDCFEPCEMCEEEHATEYNPVDEDMYCYSCFINNFCECGEDIYRDGRCEDCFVPCIACSSNHGESFYLDYCGECYYDRYCAKDCGEKIYKDGYCEDHFEPCLLCDERHASYGELCSDCDDYYSKCEKCGSYDAETNFRYINGQDMCYSCYSQYDRCDICYEYVLDTYDGLCSTCYNTYDKCERCGDYDKQLDDGLCDYCATYYEKCDFCGDYTYSTYYYNGYDLCWDCYYDYW